MLNEKTSYKIKLINDNMPIEMTIEDIKAQSIIAARKSINIESRPKLWKEISGNNGRSEMNLNELSDPLINTADIR